jgi:hypothetical protein
MPTTVKHQMPFLYYNLSLHPCVDQKVIVDNPWLITVVLFYDGERMTVIGVVSSGLLK